MTAGRDCHPPLLPQALPARVVEWILKPLRDLGCYAGVHCDVPLTLAMLALPSVAASHITGSLAAHEAICWGPPVRGRASRHTSVA